MNLLRVKVYDTREPNKFMAQQTFEYLCDRDSAFQLWWMLTQTMKYPHVEVTNMAGLACDFTKGIDNVSYAN